VEERQPAEKTVLLVHDGELSDVCARLAEAGIPCEEALPDASSVDAFLGAALVISSPNYLLERQRRGHIGVGQRMAILAGESKTARAMLTRGGIEWMVRRPVHPASLRLLVLHCLYSGPEKRRANRVTIGAMVGLRVGLRTDVVLLEEISERDCRLLLERRVATGKRVKVRIPPEIAGGKPLALKGRVVRTQTAPEADGQTEVSLVFDALRPKEVVRVREIVANHEHGPAVLKDAARPKRPERRESRSVIQIGQREEPVEPAAEPVPVSVEDPLHPERRSSARHVFERRVIAMGEQATRVLVGRDIALGGMRVNPSRALSLGDRLQIAVHVPDQETPLVLIAEVARDDGPDGLLLHFRGLSKVAESYLKEVLADLPGVSSGDDASSEESPRVITEILERRTA
jgi:hypothetical protein